MSDLAENKVLMIILSIFLPVSSAVQASSALTVSAPSEAVAVAEHRQFVAVAGDELIH